MANCDLQTSASSDDAGGGIGSLTRVLKRLREWAAFARKYRAEMAVPEREETMYRTNISAGGPDRGGFHEPAEPNSSR